MDKKLSGRSSERLIWCALVITALIGGAFLHSVIVNARASQPMTTAATTTETVSYSVRQSGDYKFINPLLFCTNTESWEFPGYKDLKNKLTDFTAEKNKADELSKISVYFRDLISGKWFGIEENAEYDPASLLKVPTMIAYFKEAETNPAILSKNVAYDGSFDKDADQNFKPQHPLEKGRVYTVDELIRSMIIESSNNAAELLERNISDDKLFEVFHDLHIPVQTTADDINFMSVKNYSYFFRVLYNASYLNREYSERALELLSEIDFTRGLRAGLPGAIVVSQKFGERKYFIGGAEQPVKELHDCGIIYYPARPYLLCVMTKGSDLGAQADTIKSISSFVYSFAVTSKN